jgi:hypothetical protein
MTGAFQVSVVRGPAVSDLRPQVFRHSFVIRHSCFVISKSASSSDYTCRSKLDSAGLGAAGPRLDRASTSERLGGWGP